MTSPTFANNRRGFTLIELLIVIGIIVLLIGILIPSVLKAMAAAQRARTSADLSSIAAALEQYHADFSAYPMVPVQNTGAAVLGKALMGLGPEGEPITTPAPATFDPTVSYGPGDLITFSGNVYVCTALDAAQPNSVSPTDPSGANYWRSAFTAPAYSASETYKPGAVVNDNGQVFVAVTTTTGNTPPTAAPYTDNYWSIFNWADGGGQGQYRSRRGGAAKDAYLQPDRFKINGTDIVDRNGNPILYFPARSTPTNIAVSKGSAASTDGSTSPRGTFFDQTSVASAMTPPWQPRFNADDNLGAFFRTSPSMTNLANQLAYARTALGDTNADGIIVTGETAKAEGAFILWSAGADNLFGPATLTQLDIDRCDDVIVSP